MRSPTRIKPIIELLERVWLLYPDLRLWQLIENCCIDWQIEDVNEAVLRLCTFANFPPHTELLWGTRNKQWAIEYKKLISLTTSHLEAILAETENESIIDAITTIINERK